MNNIFGFEKNSFSTNYIFNFRQVLIILVCMCVFIFFAMLFARKKKSAQRIMLFFCGLILFALEIGRIAWRILYFKEIGYPPTFWTLIDFNLYVISLWTTIFILIFVAFRDPKSKFSQLCFSFIFSVASIPTIYGFLYPNGLNINFSAYHFINLQYLCSHTIVMMVVVFLAITDWLENDKLENIWYALDGLVVLGVIGILTYYISGQSLNIMYMQYCPIFETLNINIPFPFHILVMGMVFFCLQVLLYVPFTMHKRIKNLKK